MSIPDFNADGVLPPGDFEVTLGQLRNSILVRGSTSNPIVGWDASWRSWLVDQFEMLANQLWHVGISNIYIDGSFVEDKAHPNDIDGYFECSKIQLANGDIERDLNYLDPQKVWTWDPSQRRPYKDYPKKQLPMWHIYRVELYPHSDGIFSGIFDEHGNNQEFPAAFRRSRRNGIQKGIVKIINEVQI